MKHNHQIAGAVAKGLVTGAVVGTAAYMLAGSSKKKTASMIKKNAAFDVFTMRLVFFGRENRRQS